MIAAARTRLAYVDPFGRVCLGLRGPPFADALSRPAALRNHSLAGTTAL